MKALVMVLTVILLLTAIAIPVIAEGDLRTFLAEKWESLKVTRLEIQEDRQTLAGILSQTFALISEGKAQLNFCKLTEEEKALWKSLMEQLAALNEEALALREELKNARTQLEKEQFLEKAAQIKEELTKIREQIDALKNANVSLREKILTNRDAISKMKSLYLEIAPLNETLKGLVEERKSIGEAMQVLRARIQEAREAKDQVLVLSLLDEVAAKQSEINANINSRIACRQQILAKVQDFFAK